MRVRLTESEKNQILKLHKPILNEGDNEDVLQCVANAADLKLVDLIKLAPCAKLQEGNPTQDDISNCIQAAEGILENKTKGMNFLEKAQYIANVGIKAAGCVAGGGGKMTIPGYGGGGISF